MNSQLHFGVDAVEWMYGNVNADAFGPTAVLFMQLDRSLPGINKQPYTQE